MGQNEFEFLAFCVCLHMFSSSLTALARDANNPVLLMNVFPVRVLEATFDAVHVHKSLPHLTCLLPATRGRETGQ